MADCDANYARLMKLFPDMIQVSEKTDEQKDERKIGIYHVEESVLTLRVLEQTPYTTLVRLGQEKNSDNGSEWFQLPVLTLRLYHDAKMAEVVTYEGDKRAFPRYEYPNERMYQKDEKAQWNQFLAEWLAHCLEHGYDVAESSYGAAPQS